MCFFVRLSALGSVVGGAQVLISIWWDSPLGSEEDPVLQEPYCPPPKRQAMPSGARKHQNILLGQEEDLLSSQKAQQEQCKQQCACTLMSFKEMLRISKYNELASYFKTHYGCTVLGHASVEASAWCGRLTEQKWRDRSPEPTWSFSPKPSIAQCDGRGSNFRTHCGWDGRTHPVSSSCYFGLDWTEIDWYLIMSAVGFKTSFPMSIAVWLLSVCMDNIPPILRRTRL